jgi:signal transduction histidine kinase
MQTSINNEAVFIAISVASGIFIFLGGLLVFFLYTQQQKKQKFIQEKAALKAQFEQEILTSENEIKEETMRYISRELHDNVVQMLSLVKIQLNGLLADNPNNQAATQSKEYLTTAITDLRSLSKTLNTDNILHEGLAKTIGFELQRVEKTGIVRTQFSDNIGIGRLDAKQEIIIFRIFQELLQNTLKHAQAKNISILLEESQENFILEVKDDGIGFDFEQKRNNKGFDNGSGLANMVYRAGLLKGSFEVMAAAGQGSVSTLTIPFQTPL